MSKKSKVVMPKEKCEIPELVNTLQGIVANLEHYVANCNQKMSAVYTIASFVRVFAYQKARFDKIRNDAADAIDSGSDQDLNSAIRQLEYAEDIKSFDYVWSDISTFYDSLIVDYCEDAVSSPYTRFQTSDEIYKDCYKQILSPKSRNSEEKRDLLRALLSI